MDKKVRELIEPFKGWITAQLSVGTLMTTIDAIIESRNEKLKDELIEKIQKLQIEKTFPPKTTDEYENEDIDKEKPRKESKALEGEAIARLSADMASNCIIKTTDNTENEYKNTIVDTLTNNFESELKTLTDANHYNNAYWFVKVPSFTTNSFYDYCHALKRKLDRLINSVETDSSSNAFYITRRQKTDPNCAIPSNSLYFTPTSILFNPKVCVLSKASSFENDDNIKITIIDVKGNTRFFQLKYHYKNAIIECDVNPNFMLFDPITEEYVLFYKSHKLLYINHDDNILTLLENKDEDKKVNDEKIEIDEDVNDEKSREKRAKIFREILEVEENKRINTRNTLKELFSEVIMIITNEKEVNENFTYGKCDLQTLKKNIRKYIRNLICKISDSEPLYIYSNSINNRYMEKPLACYRTRNYQILPDNISNNYYFSINIDCISHNVTIPITFFDRENTYFLSVRNKNKNPENKSYNFAIVNTKTKDFIVFTKDKFIFDGI